jgi:tetratricopeptide (TPR) repeat protein
MIRLTIGSFASAYLRDGPTPASIAMERCEELLDSVRGDRVLEATVKRPLALFYAMSLRTADALRLVGEASDVLDELELRSAQVYRRVGVYALELAGDLDAAERHARAIWTYFRNLRPDQLDTRARDAIVELARLYCDQGRWGEAAEAMADADSLGRDRQRAGRAGSAREIAVEARLAAHRGSLDAVPQAKEAVERSERRMGDLTTRAIVLLALAEVERSAGLARQANASLERSVELFELKGNIAAAAAIERRWAPGRQTLPAGE